MNEDLSDWNTSLHKQIQYEQEKNKLSYACKQCGSKGFYLTNEDSKLGYDCLCLNICDCTLGINLRDKWARQKEQQDKLKE